MAVPYNRMIGQGIPGVLSGHRELLATLANPGIITTMTTVPTIILATALPHFLWPSKETAALPLRSRRVLMLILALGLMLCQVLQHALEIEQVDVLAMLLTGPPFLAVVEACLVAAALSMRHTRQVQSSVIVGGCLSMSVTIDIVRLYKFALYSTWKDILPTTLTVALKLTEILLLEVSPEVPPPTQSPVSVNPTGSANGGFWNQILMLWLPKMLLSGFSGQVTLPAMSCLGPDLDSKTLAAEFEPIWKSCNKTKRPALFRASTRTLRWLFWLSAIPRVLMAVFKLAIPFLIQEVFISFEPARRDTWSAESLILTTAVIYTGYAISSALYEYCLRHCVTNLYTILTHEIITKTTRLDQVEAQDAAVLDHLSTDVDAIVETFTSCFDLAANLLQAATGVYLLTKMIGYAALLPLIVAAISLLTPMIRQGMIDEVLPPWKEAAKTRNTEMRHALSHRSWLKIMGFEHIMGQFLHDLFEKEMGLFWALQDTRALITACRPLSYWSTYIVTMIGALALTRFKHGLQPMPVVTVLVLLSPVTTPISVVFTTASQFNALLAHFSNIENYLLLPERVDGRIIKDFTLGDKCRRKVVYSDDSSNEYSDEDSDEDSDESSYYSSDEEYSEFTDEEEDEVEEAFKQRCFSLTDVTVVAKDSDRLVLDRLHFSIAKSTVVMVIGPPASGKSTLLKALMGEANLERGTIQMADQQIAFCDYDSWLPNQTVRNIITGGSKYDPERYRSVLEACVLSDNDNMFPGDINAGIDGQQIASPVRQRIALARAVYSSAPTIIIDDILQGQEFNTGVFMFGELLGSTGLLKEQGRTVIVATESSDWIWHADQVILTRVNGRATSHSVPEAIKLLPKMRQPITPTKQLREPPKQNMLEKLNGFQDDYDLMQRSSNDANQWSLFAFYYSSISRPVIFIVFAIIFLLGALETSPMVYTKLWLEARRENMQSYLVHLFTVLGITTAISIGATWKCMVKMTPSSALNMHKIFITTLMSAPFGVMTSPVNSTLLHNFNRSMGLFTHDIPEAVYQVFYGFGLVVANAALMSSGATYAVVLIPVILVPLYKLMVFYGSALQRIHRMDAGTKAALYLDAYEMARGLGTTRSSGSLTVIRNQIMRRVGRTQVTVHYAYCAKQWQSLVVNLTAAIVSTAFISISLLCKGTMSPTNLGLAMVAMTSYSEVNANLVRRWASMHRSLGMVHFLKTFTETTPPEPAFDTTKATEPDWDNDTTIQFTKVSAKYGSSEDSREVLRNINLTVPSGIHLLLRRKYRIRASLTSLVLTLLRRLNYRGKVSIGGVDIMQIPPEALRRKITVLAEDPMDLPGTILDNLFPFNHSLYNDGKPFELPSEEAIKQTLREVQLWTTIDSAGGLETPMKDINLSDAQREHLSIARAILHRRATGSAILLMDDCLRVERRTNVAIHQAVNAAFAGCTRVSIRNRGYWMLKADEFFHLANGTVCIPRSLDVLLASDKAFQEASGGRGHYWDCLEE